MFTLTQGFLKHLENVVNESWFWLLAKKDKDPTDKNATRDLHNKIF